MSVFGGSKGPSEPTEAVVATAESYLKAAEAALDSIKMPDFALFKNLKRPPGVSTMSLMCAIASCGPMRSTSARLIRRGAQR